MTELQAVFEKRKRVGGDERSLDGIPADDRGTDYKGNNLPIQDNDICRIVENEVLYLYEYITYGGAVDDNAYIRPAINPDPTKAWKQISGLSISRLVKDVTIDGTLTVLGGVTGVFPAGTVLLFGQASAPVGWTKITEWNDNAMLTLNCEVNGTALESGGSVNPQSSHFHTTQGHALTLDELASHSHSASGSFTYWRTGSGASNNFHLSSSGSSATYSKGVSISVSSNGGSSSHDHGDTLENDQPLFQEIIACSKD